MEHYSVCTRATRLAVSVFILAFLILGIHPASSYAQRRQPATWLSESETAVLAQLSSLEQLSAGEWRVHDGDIPHAEDVELDDSTWKAAEAGDPPANAVWFRRWGEVPKMLNGYNLAGARIY